MSPEETVVLQKIGYVIDNGVAWVITLTFFHGVFIILFGMSTVSIIRRGIQKVPQLSMFVVTLATFLIATLYLDAQLASLSMTVRTFFIENAELPLLEKVDVFRWKVFPTNLMIIWASELVHIISDAVVIWRAWVILSLGRKLLLVPLALWVGAIATALTYLVAASSFDGIQNLNIGGVQQYLFTASIALSLGANLTATLLIAYKLWAAYHRDFAGALGKKTMVQNVLIILVESGAIYCVLQLVAVVMSIAPDGGTGGVPGSAEWVAAQVFASAYVEISAMYASAIVVLVNARRSIADTYGFSDVVVDAESQVPGRRGLSEARVRSGTLGRLSFINPLPQSVVSTRSTSSDGGSGGGDPASVEKLFKDGMRGDENVEGSSDIIIEPR